jgi:hypothetical protein
LLFWVVGIVVATNSLVVIVAVFAFIFASVLRLFVPPPLVLVCPG